jgi:hypothetical protein
VGVGVAVGVTVGVAVGVTVGLALGVEVSVGLVDGDGVDVLGSGDGVVLGEELPDVSDGDALAGADDELTFAVEPASMTLVGSVAQVDVVVPADVEATVDARLASTPSAPNVPKPRKANAVSAPRAAGLMISGLTRATSFRSASWQDKPAVQNPNNIGSQAQCFKLVRNRHRSFTSTWPRFDPRTGRSGADSLPQMCARNRAWLCRSPGPGSPEIAGRRHVARPVWSAVRAASGDCGPQAPARRPDHCRVCSLGAMLHPSDG